MKRGLYTRKFRYPGATGWECPSCIRGKLIIIKDTFHYEETEKSRFQHSSEGFTPWDVDYVYSCLLKCSMCNDIISSSGTGCVAMEYTCDEYGHCPDYSINEFSPEHFSPNLKLFKYPKTTDIEVAKELNKSFSLFFCDPSSSANHIRIAIEKLLDYLKVDSVRKNGKYINLHSRIEKLSDESDKYNKYKNHLIAIKFIGNAGSHSDKRITKNDVLDAYEIINELLIEIFDKKSEKMDNMIKEINEKKGPRSN